MRSPANTAALLTTLLLPLARGQSYEAHVLVPTGGSMFTGSSCSDVSDNGRVVARNVIDGVNTSLEWTPGGGFATLNLAINGVGRVNVQKDNLYASVMLQGDGTIVNFQTPAGTPLMSGLEDLNNQRVVVGSSPGSGFPSDIFVWDPVNGSRGINIFGASGLLRVSESNLAVGNIEITSGSSQGFIVDVFSGAWTHLGDALSAPGSSVDWSRVVDVNIHGDVIGNVSGTVFRAFLRTADGHVTYLPGLAGGDPVAVSPYALDDSGQVVGSALTPNGMRAFRFSPQTGMHDLNDESSVPPGFTLARATEISETGVIIGVAFGSTIAPRGFVLDPGPWLDRGLGKGGALGVPVLSGAGDLTAGSSASVTMSNTPPSAPSVLFVGGTADPTPFLGGTLLPATPLLTVAFTTSPTGTSTLPFITPIGLTGTSFFLQHAIADPTASQGVALSNALQAAFP